MPATSGVLETYSATIDGGFADGDFFEIIPSATEKMTQPK